MENKPYDKYVRLSRHPALHVPRIIEQDNHKATTKSHFPGALRRHHAGGLSHYIYTCMQIHIHK